jgi:hypothetical protein
MAVDKAKIQQAIELMHQANSLIQSAGIPQPDNLDEDPVYKMHNIIENAIMDVEETLDDVGVILI